MVEVKLGQLEEINACTLLEVQSEPYNTIYKKLNATLFKEQRIDNLLRTFFFLLIYFLLLQIVTSKHVKTWH